MACFLATRAGPWVLAIVIKVPREVVGLAHQLVVVRAARCVPPSLFFLALIRVNAEFAYFVHRCCADISASDIFHVQDVFVPIALNLGEVFLGLAIRHPRRAVSFVLFLFGSELTACHVAGHTR